MTSKIKFPLIVTMSIVLQVLATQVQAIAVIVLGDEFYIIGTDTSNSPPEAVWGATAIANSSRPERAWINSFGVVTESGINTGPALQNTIDNCADYCVIEINQLRLSSTIFINTSKVKLLGKTGNKITFTGNDSLFHVETGASEIVFENLLIDGEDKARNSSDVFGIFIEGESINRVQVKNNTIKNLHSENNAHGIAAYGTGSSELTSISDIIIEGNTLDDLRTGSSESIVVNGNVKQWEILNNRVSNVNNIAIDAIGGEGISPTQVVNGRILPGDYDAAREGFIEGNTVTNMSTLGNSQYDNVRSWAAGIYVDGGRDISISGNTMINTPWAYEIGAENCVETTNITLSNNTAVGSYYGDLVMGGYATKLRN